MTARGGRVLLGMTGAAGGLLSAAVGLVARGASGVAGGGVRLGLVTLGAVRAAGGRVVRQTGVAAGAVPMAGVVMGFCAFGLVTVRAEGGLTDAGAEGMGLVAFRALQARSAVPAVVAGLVVATRAGSGSRLGAGTRGVRRVAVHTGGSSAGDGWVVGVHAGMATRTGTLCPDFHVVRVVAARTGAVLGHHGGTQCLVPLVTPLTGRGCSVA